MARSYCADHGTFGSAFRGQVEGVEAEASTPPRTPVDPDQSGRIRCTGLPMMFTVHVVTSNDVSFPLML